MNLVEIRVINVDKPLWISELETFCLLVLADIGKRDWSISIVLCDNEFIRGLNNDYRGIDRPTDVLSFPQELSFPTETNTLAGDIAVSLDYMRQNAREYGVSEGEEIKRLLIHGVLHLAGMDHDENAVGGEMLDLQDAILRKHIGELKF